MVNFTKQFRNLMWKESIALNRWIILDNNFFYKICPVIFREESRMSMHHGKTRSWSLCPVRAKFCQICLFCFVLRTAILLSNTLLCLLVEHSLTLLNKIWQVQQGIAITEDQNKNLQSSDWKSPKTSAVFPSPFHKQVIREFIIISLFIRINCPNEVCQGEGGMFFMLKKKNMCSVAVG